MGIYGNRIVYNKVTPTHPGPKARELGGRGWGWLDVDELGPRGGVGGVGSDISFRYGGYHEVTYMFNMWQEGRGKIFL